MKANEAPEKIYYAPYGDMRENTPITDNDIEYVRTDVFIKKACEKLEMCMYKNLMFQGRLHRKEVIGTFIEDFKKAMKDE